MNSSKALASFLATLPQGFSLSPKQAEDAFTQLLSDDTSPVQIAAFLTALSMRGETADDLLGAVKALHKRMLPFDAPPDTIDICGTGGDNSGSLNISTAVGFVVAGAGVKVAKHGNRAITSSSGSSDVLAALGVQVQAAPTVMQRALREAHIAFLQAPAYHPALAQLAPIRLELGFRTIFNLVGPLANPAQVKYQLLGVYDPRLLLPMAQVLQKLGTTRAWVVCGDGGLDELSLSGPSKAIAVEGKTLRRFIVDPKKLKLKPISAAALKGKDAAYNAKCLRALLEGEASAYRDIVLLNAAAALVVAGKSKSLPQGLHLAADAIDSGAALTSLERLVAITSGAA